jgi:hypothetical protein
MDNDPLGQQRKRFSIVTFSLRGGLLEDFAVRNRRLNGFVVPVFFIQLSRICF